ELTDMINKLEGDNAELERQIADLRAQLEEIETDNEQQASLIAELLARIESLENKLSDEDSEVDQDEEDQVVDDLDDRLIESDEPGESDEDEKEALPQTATSIFNYLLIGASILILGLGLTFYLYQRRKEA